MVNLFIIYYLILKWPSLKELAATFVAFFKISKLIILEQLISIVSFF